MEEVWVSVCSHVWEGAGSQLGRRIAAPAWALLERLPDATVSCMGLSSCNSADGGSWLEGHLQALSGSQTLSGHEHLTLSTILPKSAYFAELQGGRSSQPSPVCS